jgi:ParB/RepB/Spo0J family partition protein
MADPKKKKHSMHGAMGALLDELDRTGAVSPPNLVSPTTKEAEKRFVEETPAKPVDSTMPSLGPKGRGDTLPYTRSNEQLVKIPAARVQPWYLRNRQEPDMGDMQDLIDSIATDGQAIPILIRPVRGQHAEGITHEVYAGYRRWTACKELNIDVLAIIRDVDDQEAAIIQETENEDREQISPASRAFHYKTLLEQHIFPSETALATSLHLHRSTLNDLLSYTRLDPALAEGPLAIFTSCRSALPRFWQRCAASRATSHCWYSWGQRLLRARSPPATSSSAWSSCARASSRITPSAPSKAKTDRTCSKYVTTPTVHLSSLCCRLHGRSPPWTICCLI